MATRTYEIKFNFEQEEPQELSVMEGELVRAPGMCCFEKARLF
jgi:hypothetical protein